MSDPAGIRQAVIDALLRVAPEADPATITDDEPLRDQLDLDSMDFLNVIVGLHERLGVQVPERDYPRLDTIQGAVGYLREALERG